MTHERRQMMGVAFIFLWFFCWRHRPLRGDQPRDTNCSPLYPLAARRRARQWGVRAAGSVEPALSTHPRRRGWGPIRTDDCGGAGKCLHAAAAHPIQRTLLAPCAALPTSGSAAGIDRLDRRPAPPPDRDEGPPRTLCFRTSE